MTDSKAEQAAAAKKAEQEKAKASICVDCFGGVWPVGAHSATCEHGKWQRDQGEADDEAEKARADEKAAADAEAARQQVRQQG